jgi:hypothetical protein
MAREGSKRQVAIEIMTANSDKPMAEVIALIASANGLTSGAARSYYVYIAAQGWAPGKVEATVRVKAEKPVKVAKPKAEPKAAKPKAEAKSPEEIEKIKAANLKRLKEVHAKVKQNVKRDEPEVLEVDPFVAPAALTRDEVTALV